MNLKSKFAYIPDERTEKNAEPERIESLVKFFGANDRNYSIDLKPIHGLLEYFQT